MEKKITDLLVKYNVPVSKAEIHYSHALKIWHVIGNDPTHLRKINQINKVIERLTVKK